MNRNGETICALATACGGALATIRVSGPECYSIVDKLFFPADKGVRLKEHNGFSIIHGDIRENSELIDEVLINLYKGPHSYTGEDSVEISCHGSFYVITKILELLVKNGAVSALPGEFTRRAFMNGKMDLSQAEAVADLVASDSKAAHRIAINQIRGGFSAEIAKLRSELLRFTSLIELELDFGEEDVEFADRKELRKLVIQARQLAESLASSFKLGNVIKNGFPIAIVGKPNSGKSTLLNALLNEERAIVSPIPGTTRDAIEDTININGLVYRFIDTAGLRETSDEIEVLGIRKTKEKMMQASVILLVDEASEKTEEINRRADIIRRMITDPDVRLIILINKIDGCDNSVIDELSKKIYLDIDDTLLFISGEKHIGLDKLRRRLARIFEKRGVTDEGVIITNIRHYEALKRVSESLERVIAGLDEKRPDDLITTDIRQAIHYLGEITGEITTDEILENIFRNFCIGK
jgi:tRNA modification GTPase